MKKTLQDTANNGAAKKLRHEILRALQRADWALQENDPADALNAVIRAIRAAAKLDPYLDRPDTLSTALGKAVTAVMDSALGGVAMSSVILDVAPVLVLVGEVYKGCDYGM